MKIDNFALTMYQTCPEKFRLRMIEGWTPSRRSGALGFGGAFHEGLAAWYRTGNIGQALLAIDKSWPDNMPVDDFRTKAKCAQVMIDYAKKYPHETFKTVQGPSGPFIEVPFTLDTGMELPAELSWLTEKAAGVPYPAGNEPIEYGGIFDGLVNFGSAIYVLEHKTTSMLGAMYFNQFKPNNQVTGYVWAAGQMSGKPVGGAIINAIGVYKVGATKFERHITARFPEEIAEWMQNVYNVCIQIKRAQYDALYTKSTNACTMYGMCEFHSVCSLARVAERRKRLEMDYVQEPWDYELRGGTEVPSV